MNACHIDPLYTLYHGDALEVLKELPDESVHCCVTSPPYWGLRDYGVAGQLGLEKTPDEYVAKMVEVFREVRRVLRDDGTFWLNLGDTYARDPGKGDRSEYLGLHKNISDSGCHIASQCREMGGLKPKDMIGIPWRVAFALQADGWVLRQEIVWNKCNPMPESVTDRCTKSHEQIFMFAKARWSGPEPGRFAHINDQDARWLALFLDTEGNVCAKRVRVSSGQDHFGAQICFAGTSRPLLERAKAIIGHGTILQRAGKNAPMFYYQLSNCQAAALLYELYPHLIVKQRQAALAIYLQDLIAESGRERRSKEGRLRGRLRDDDYTEELIRIWATMKSLNRFGSPDLSWVPIPKYGRWADCERYYYDAEAIKEPVTGNAHPRGDGVNPKCYNGSDFRNGKKALIHENTGQSDRHHHTRPKQNPSFSAAVNDLVEIRNKRSVWTVATSPYPEAHFATYPPDLIKPCILAGCPIDGTVLDPFAGSGTTGQVALELGRKAVLIELNAAYLPLIQQRLHTLTPGLRLG